MRIVTHDGRYLCAYGHRSGPAWYDVIGPRPVLAGNTPDTTFFSWTDTRSPVIPAPAVSGTAVS